MRVTPDDTPGSRRSEGMVTRMVTQWIRRVNPRGGRAPGTAHQYLAPTGYARGTVHPLLIHFEALEVAA